MRYLFFDTEWANYYDGSPAICEIGYVITDERFKTIERRNITINPCCKFRLLGRKKHKDIHLVYEDNNYERYKHSKKYVYFYDLLMELFTQKDTIIFGFGCLQDMKGIRLSNQKYCHKDFLFDAIDIQALMYIYQRPKNNNQHNLLETFNNFYPAQKNKIPPHKAENDSYMSMLILKMITKKMHRSVSELISTYPEIIIKGDNSRFIYKPKECEQTAKVNNNALQETNN